jgi:hypothetical protein
VLKVKRRRRKGASVELRVVCPMCGSEAAEVNPGISLWNCFKCPGGGPIPESWKNAISDADKLSFMQGRSVPPKRRILELPPHAIHEIERRGFDPHWIVSEYGVHWDGERMVWPAGRGRCRRAVHPWQNPKTLTEGNKGLIGQERLRAGAHVVVCEGDYKAACIPLPWVGVGIMGTSMTYEQRILLLHSNPASISVVLDVGYDAEARRIARSLRPFPAQALSLQGVVGQGPDDVGRHEVYKLLLSRRY